MPRESIEELIARNAALNAEQFEIDEKLSALPPEQLWVVSHDMTNDPIELTPQQEKVKASFLALNSRKFAIQAQLKRAHLFGLHHTKGVLPTLCLDCFVDHNKDSLMIEVESNQGNGIRKFECPICKHVLQIDPL